MVKPAEILAMRISERAAQMGMSDYAISNAIEPGKPDIVRDIRRGRMPRHDRLVAIARVLNTSVDWLTGGGSPNLASPSRGWRGEYDAAPAATAVPVPDLRARDLPRDVPVMGTVLGCNNVDFDDGDVPVEAHQIDQGDVIDFVRRPGGIAGARGAYALYINGDSQSPRFEPGELIYVNPARPAAIGDDVVVQLTDGADGDRMVCALIKRLRKRTASEITLEQFNPPRLITLPVARVRAIHRVMPLAELLGFS